MASLSAGIAAFVIHPSGFIPLLPYCDLHLWPLLPSHKLCDWEPVRLYAFYVLNAPLQWPKPAKWLLSTAPELGWVRLVSLRGGEGSERLQRGVAVGLVDPWKKVSWKAWEERSCLNGSFLSLFLPLAGAETPYGYLWACGRVRGAALKPTSPLCWERRGWAEGPVTGLVLSYIHAHARTHTIKNSSQSCNDRGEDSVARQIWWMRYTSHKSISRLMGTSGIAKQHADKSQNHQGLIYIKVRLENSGIFQPKLYFLVFVGAKLREHNPLWLNQKPPV